MPLRLSLGLAGLLFLALAVLSKGWLEAGGLVIFDSRFPGYSHDEAEHLIRTLGSDGIALYLGLFRVLDTLFPLALCLSLLLLARRAGNVFGLAGVVAALAYLFFDLRENALVAEMLRSAADLGHDLVASASSATFWKWITLAVSFLSLCAAWVLKARKEARP